MHPENGFPGRSVGRRYEEQAVKSASSKKGMIQLVWPICRGNDSDIASCLHEYTFLALH